MFITRAKYNRLIEDKEEWRDIAIRVQKTNQSMLKTAEQVRNDNQDLLNINKDLLKAVDNLNAEKAVIAKEIFEEIDKFIRAYVHNSGYTVDSLTYDLENLKKKYIGE